MRVVLLQVVAHATFADWKWDVERGKSLRQEPHEGLANSSGANYSLREGYSRTYQRPSEWPTPAPTPMPTRAELQDDTVIMRQLDIEIGKDDIAKMKEYAKTTARDQIPEALAAAIGSELRIITNAAKAVSVEDISYGYPVRITYAVTTDDLPTLVKALPYVASDRLAGVMMSNIHAIHGLQHVAVLMVQMSAPSVTDPGGGPLGSEGTIGGLWMDVSFTIPDAEAVTGITESAINPGYQAKVGRAFARAIEKEILATSFNAEVGVNVTEMKPDPNGDPQVVRVEYAVTTDHIPIVLAHLPGLTTTRLAGLMMDRLRMLPQLHSCLISKIHIDTTLSERERERYEPDPEVFTDPPLNATPVGSKDRLRYRDYTHDDSWWHAPVATSAARFWDATGTSAMERKAEAKAKTKVENADLDDELSKDYDFSLVPDR